MLKKYICLVLISFFVAGCSDLDTTIPDGFEVIASEKAHHFVYMKKKYSRDSMAQRKACNAICNKFNGKEVYCQVMFWKIRSEVPTKFPIMGRRVPIGKCIRSHDGKYEQKIF